MATPHKLPAVPHPAVFDIGANLTHASFHADLPEVLAYKAAAVWERYVVAKACAKTYPTGSAARLQGMNAALALHAQWLNLVPGV